MQIHKSQMLYALLSNPGLLNDGLADIVMKVNYLNKSSLQFGGYFCLNAYSIRFFIMFANYG